MNDGPCWPSRRFVIAIIVATVITTVAIVVPDITLPFRDPAEAAYQEGWIPQREGNGCFVVVMEFDEDAAAVNFRKAFRLNPRVLRYQLSLAQALHGNRAALEQLLQDRRLLPEARAATEYYLGLCWMNMGLRRNQYVPSISTRKLETALSHFDLCTKLDRQNAAPWYAKARSLYALGRDEEAAQAVGEGNQKPSFQNIITHPVFGRSMAGGLYLGGLSEFDAHNKLGRNQLAYARVLLQQRKANTATRVLEDTVVFGKRRAAAKPTGVLGYLVGRAIFRLSYPELARIYPKSSADRQRLVRTAKAYDYGLRRIKAFIRRDLSDFTQPGSSKLVVALTALWIFVQYSCPVAVMATIFSAAFYLVRSVRARRRGEPRYELEVWQSGELARSTIRRVGFMLLLLVGLTLSFHSPFAWLLISILLGGFSAHLATFTSDMAARRAYVEREGTEAWPPFSLRRRAKKPNLPLAHELWRERHAFLAEAANLLMFVWVALALLSIYRVSLGAYPWQLGIMGIDTFEREGAIVSEALTHMPK